MMRARAWLALVILLGGLAAFLWSLCIAHDPLGAVGVLTAALIVGELVRPSYDVIRAQVDKATQDNS
jgi:uncharacterized membrane protein YiaA